jgi:exosortase/archaeosortase family protein
MDNERFPVGAIRRHAASLSDALAIGGGYPLLLTLTFLMEVRWSIALAISASDEGVLAWLDHVNYLPIAEWLCILDIARGADWSRISAGRLEGAAGLALVIYATLFIAPTSHYLVLVLGVAMALKFGFACNLWPLSACLLLVSVQNQLGKGLFGFSLNDLSAAMDAQGAHYLLSFAGYMNDVTGTVVRLRNSAHAIEIRGPCATTFALFEVLAAFGVFSIWLRREPRWQVLLLAGVIVAAVVLVNWLRLSLMAISKPSYDYWHSGPGASIISFCYALLAFSLAKMGARAGAAGIETANAGSSPSWVG